VISQDVKPSIAFYSRKLSPTQQRYSTTTERELLTIVETFKKIKKLLLGQQITVFTNHQSSISENTQMVQTLRWRLLIEEYSPKLVHSASHRNVVTDALSRLDLATRSSLTAEESAMSEVFASVDITPVTYSLQFERISVFQQKKKNY